MFEASEQDAHLLAFVLDASLSPTPFHPFATLFWHEHGETLSVSHEVRMASSVAMMPPPPASSSSSSTSMNALESGAPAIGAYDYGAMSQPATQMTQPTQTQTQTQSSQADYAGANARVPVNWWAVLISSVPTPTQAEIEEQGQQRAANGGDTDAYVQRPFRVELHVDSAECIVGRHPRSNLYLAGKKISARHARIYREDDGTVKLEDLSSNGTFVNGVKVRASMLTSARVRC